jgi:hypothetical protein
LREHERRLIHPVTVGHLKRRLDVCTCKGHRNLIEDRMCVRMQRDLVVD